MFWVHLILSQSQTTRHFYPPEADRNDATILNAPNVWEFDYYLDICLNI